jgi:2,3-dihydroxybenzoate decarboxylase
VDHAADWFDAASISETDRRKIGRHNAARLFKLDRFEAGLDQAAE